MALEAAGRGLPGWSAGVARLGEVRVGGCRVAKASSRLSIIICEVNIGGGARWYLRSAGDRDTHYGSWSGHTGSVRALCGAEFQPFPLPYGGTFLPGTPLHEDQVCPDCRSKISGLPPAPGGDADS